LRTCYLDFQVRRQYLHEIKKLTCFGIVLMLGPTDQQKPIFTLHYTWDPRPTPKWLLDFQGMTFGWVLKVHRISMVMGPQHNVKGAYGGS
jgi:hypothetical protein